MKIETQTWELKGPIRHLKIHFQKLLILQKVIGIQVKKDDE